MANMFSGNSVKRIPITLDECTVIDPVSNNLWTWAERLERWGKILFVILIIIGIVATVEVVGETEKLLDEIEDTYYDYRDISGVDLEIPSVGEVLVNSLIEWTLYAFLEFCAYHVLALLIGSLASITQNNAIAANVALLQARDKCTVSNVTHKPDFVDNASKAPVSYPRATAPGAAQGGAWTCRHCGTQNKDQYGQCKKCGQYRS